VRVQIRIAVTKNYYNQHLQFVKSKSIFENFGALGNPLGILETVILFMDYK
jgi:hypothetical protein